MRIKTKFERSADFAKLAKANPRIYGSVVKKDDMAVLNIEDETAEETNVNVQGVVGSEWDGLSAGQLVTEIQSIDTPITLRMNTPGGFVNDALDIYDALVEHPHHVRADIVSEAWSAGTIITSAADEVRIRPAAKYGVHCAWSGLVIVGNAREMRAQVPQLEAYTEYLDKLDIQIAEIIAHRSAENVTADDVYEWMVGPEGCDGTEWVGEEAVEAGLADSLIQSKPKNARKLVEGVLNISRSRTSAEDVARQRAIRLAKIRSLTNRN